MADALVGGPRRGRPAVEGVDGARIAVELGHFQNAIDTLMPKAGLIDSDALASLSLALEGVGRSDDAISVLVQHFKGGTSSTDAQGILAGRLKRKWLVGRPQQGDLDRAKELYSDALKRSEAKETTLRPIITPSTSPSWTSFPHRPIPTCQSLCDEMARRAQSHCSQASQTQWRFATEAEASLMLGDLDGAEALYRRAAALTGSPREIEFDVRSGHSGRYAQIRQGRGEQDRKSLRSSELNFRG